MSESEEPESPEESLDSSYPDDRRHLVRRVSKDRRDKIRYEIEKIDRRLLSDLDRRKVKDAGSEYVEHDEDDNQKEHDSDNLFDSVVGKINNIFRK